MTAVTTNIGFHPIADLFPLMEGAEFDELVADIKANGLREPIFIWRKKILDGRNRYRACLAAGVEPRFLDAAYKQRSGRFDPVAFVISANIHRRHLTVGQKREIIAKLIKAQPEKSNRQIATAAGVSHTHVNKVRVEEAGDVETVSTSLDTKGRKQPRKKQTWGADDQEFGEYINNPGARELRARRDQFLKDAARALAYGQGYDGLIDAHVIQVAKAVRDTWAKLVRELKKEKESANAVSDTAEASP